MESRLGQRIVQEHEVWVRPLKVAQVPDQIVEVATLGIGPLQDRVQLPGQERRAVVMLETAPIVGSIAVLGRE